MKLIVGLGNPGNEYHFTRHNAGFMVIDELCARLKVATQPAKKLKADICVSMRGGETIIIVKPQTFMNLSGQCVAKIANFYKISTDNIWVVSDDLDLDFGIVRVRVGGSSGGHNGLKDMIDKLGDGFTRFRIGIGNDTLAGIPSEKFVLQKFSAGELELIPSITSKASEMLLDALDNGITHISKK